MSKQYVGPYINFQGRAREAMEFYHQVLGGKLDLHTVDEQGKSKPAGPEDRIAHAQLEADGARIVGSDGHPKYPAKVGENMAIAVGGTDSDRIARIFNDLAEGGRIKGPITAQPWGAAVGWLTDKFGFDWMVSIDKM
ncbi:MAG: VOC family protein [Candidatus Dormibacteraeota bacterium]|nr:VOC family protein [Candidatus Dormibacteraeota bacterium]